ncbi:MAG: NAD(P)/FAD-dependent oxidoreductase [Chloroflexota bacterium]
MQTEHVDILVVGAGLSGIGAGYHIQDKCPDKSYAILEGREAMGGTWDLFRYPGVRSDSDMFTLGYSFHPWTSKKVISSGESILDYIRLTAEKFGIDQHIRYSHRVYRVSWSSEDALWTVDVQVGENKTPQQFTCKFLYLCTGYYAYDYGFTPEFEGWDNYQGEIVHPQKWTEDIDYADKHIIVIGSGATAVTLVPAMAEQAEHVTMLQRSPTYIVSAPSEDEMAMRYYKWFGEKTAHTLSRWTAILYQIFQFQLMRRFPNFMKSKIMDWARPELPNDFDVDKHLNPSYKPWDQRVCLIPDSDLFNAISAGKASIVTDHIERFTENGILLKSGNELEADMIVTATGLRLKIMHGVDLIIDGAEFDLSNTYTYKGLMYGNIPNMAQSFGYTNASWTLKSELISEYMCRLVNYMDENNYDYCVPVLTGNPENEGRPALDFNSTYVLRALDEMPKQGPERPWVAHQNYVLDMMDIRYGKLDEGNLKFRNAVRQSATETKVAEPV